MNLLLFCLFVHASALAPLLSTTAPEDLIAHQWLIVFKPELSLLQRKAHLLNIPKIFNIEKRLSSSDQVQAEVLDTFSIHKLHGYSARLSKQHVEELRQSEQIMYIEQDRVMRAYDIDNNNVSIGNGKNDKTGTGVTCTRQEDVAWNLHRISTQGPLNEIDPDYLYPSTAGVGVKIFVIDTGININHHEFGGRAEWGANFVDDQNKDCQGHGTHVAGIIAGEKYGVAKRSVVIAVKVLGCDGKGSVATVLKGLEYAVNTGTTPSIINLSLGGTYTATLNTAVNNAISQGFLTVVAAGNEGKDACSCSPASASLAFTVGATTQSPDDTGGIDERSWFSNYGSCVHIFAPGTLIKSAWSTSQTATNTISGTSMAAPHVAGVAALYLSTNPIAQPQDVKIYVSEQSSYNLIQLDCSNAVCKQSPNSLLFSTCVD